MAPKKKPQPFHIIPRSKWGAAPAGRSMADQAPPREAFVHYSDVQDAATVSTEAEAFAAARSIQHFHMVSRGWSDIAYHFLLVQLQGRGETAVLSGRDPRKVPAAQLGHNTGTLAICVHAGPLDEITSRTRFCVEELLRLHPQVASLGGHRDVTSTDCPGEHLYKAIPTMARAAGVAVYHRSAR